MKENDMENKIYFPRNVSVTYQLFGIEGLGWPAIKRYILPTIGIMVLVFLIPPYASLIFWIIKIFILLLAFIYNIFMILLKPIPARKNINMETWLKYQRDYSKRQKEYFINKKNRKINGK